MQQYKRLDKIGRVPFSFRGTCCTPGKVAMAYLWSPTCVKLSVWRMALLIWLARLLLLTSQSEATRPMALAASATLATLRPAGPAYSSTCRVNKQWVSVCVCKVSDVNPKQYCAGPTHCWTSIQQHLQSDQAVGVYVCVSPLAVHLHSPRACHSTCMTCICLMSV